MTIRDITDENVSEYEGQIPEEWLGNIGREYCRGLVGLDIETDDLCAAVFWEIKNVENDSEEIYADIAWFFAESEEDGDELLQVFDIRASYDEVERIFFEIKDLREHEVAALKKNGFQVENAESRDVVVSVLDLAKLSFMKRKPPEYVKKISDISPRQFKAGVMSSIFHRRYGLLEDLPFLPVSWFEPDLSCCVMTDDKVSGLLLVHETTDSGYRIELLFAMQPDAESNLLNMMRFSVRQAAQHCLKDDEVILRRHNPATKALVKKLFPEKKGAPVWKGEKVFENDE